MPRRRSCARDCRCPPSPGLRPTRCWGGPGLTPPQGSSSPTSPSARGVRRGKASSSKTMTMTTMTDVHTPRDARPLPGSRITRRATLVGVAAVAIVVDVASKVAAAHYLNDGPFALGELLTLRLVYNAGVAFGVGASAPAAVVMAVTGLANLADRFTGGSVVDMFDVGWWPSFNLADVLLLTGVALILVSGHRPWGRTSVEPGGAPQAAPAERS